MSSPLYCAFPRQPIQRNMSVEECIVECVASKGCQSVNYKPDDTGMSGDCVLLAPSADGQVDPGDGQEDGWMLYGLMFDDMI